MKALIALSFVGLIIGLGWLYFSYSWNRQLKVAEFIAKHHDYLIEKMF